MAFCPSCGTQVEGRFCAKCGTPADGPPPQAAPPPPQAPRPTPPPPEPAAPVYQQPSGYQPPPQPSAQGGLEENIASALCYLVGLITGVLFLALAPYNQNKTIRFHAFQSIFMHVALIGFGIVMMILTMIMPRFIRVIISMAYMLCSLAFLGLWLLLMFKAYNREKFKIPVIGDLAEKQA